MPSPASPHACCAAVVAVAERAPDSDLAAPPVRIESMRMDHTGVRPAVPGALRVLADVVGSVAVVFVAADAPAIALGPTAANLPPPLTSTRLLI